MALRQRGKNGYWHAYFRQVPGFDANRAKLGKTVSPDLKKEFFIQFKPFFPTKILEKLKIEYILCTSAVPTPQKKGNRIMASSTTTTPTQTRRVKRTRRVITRADVQNFIKPHLESPEKARAFLKSMGARFGKNGEITSVRPIKVRIAR